MPITVFGIVLIAAGIHAAWNALVKGAGDKLLTTILIVASAASLAIVILPALQPPDRASWPFLVAAALFQMTYYGLLARLYHGADMSQTYPVMRGTAPLLVALVSALGLGEPLSPGMWIGVGLICLGILCMTLGLRRGNHHGVRLAVLTGVVIAGYTLLDGFGVRRSRAPAAYTLWEFLLTGLPVTAWALLTRRTALAGYFRENWHYGLIGGVGTVISYGLALWAMTIAPVAVVAALRETSILFGVAIAGLLLNERINFTRVVAACIIAAGAIALRLA